MIFALPKQRAFYFGLFEVIRCCQYRKKREKNINVVIWKKDAAMENEIDTKNYQHEHQQDVAMK